MTFILIFQHRLLYVGLITVMAMTFACCRWKISLLNSKLVIAVLDCNCLLIVAVSKEIFSGIFHILSYYSFVCTGGLFLIIV